MTHPHLHEVHSLEEALVDLCKAHGCKTDNPDAIVDWLAATLRDHAHELALSENALRDARKCALDMTAERDAAVEAAHHYADKGVAGINLEVVDMLEGTIAQLRGDEAIYKAALVELRASNQRLAAELADARIEIRSLIANRGPLD